MALWKINEKDMKRGVTVKQGWHRVKIVEYQEKPAGTDGSANSVFRGEIQGGEFNEVSLYWQFNEKAPGFAKNFIIALGGNLTEKGGEFNFGNHLVGEVLDVHVSNNLYKGKVQNEVDDWKKAS